MEEICALSLLTIRARVPTTLGSLISAETVTFQWGQTYHGVKVAGPGEVMRNGAWLADVGALLVNEWTKESMEGEQSLQLRKPRMPWNSYLHSPWVGGSGKCFIQNGRCVLISFRSWMPLGWNLWSSVSQFVMEGSSMCNKSTGVSVPNSECFGAQVSGTSCSHVGNESMMDFYLWKVKHMVEKQKKRGFWCLGT